MILYLCPEFPYPANTGGKRVFESNVKKLAAGNDVFHIFFFNNSFDKIDEKTILNLIQELSIYPNFLSLHIIDRIESNFKVGTGCFSLVRSLLSNLPRAWFVRKVIFNDEQRNILNTASKIIVDHAAAFGMLDKSLWSDRRICYISHNIEAKIIKESMSDVSVGLKKILFLIDYIKMKHQEYYVLSNVNKVLFISDEDMAIANEITKNRHNEYIYTPFYLPMKDKKWAFRPEMLKNINALFVGGSDYFPNFDASKWIIDVLANQYPFVTFNIVGKNEELKKYYNGVIPNNVKLHGRVSDEDLEALYLKSTFFISPIKYGSGIKIKMLEAASFGIPIVSSKESLIGLSFIKNGCLVFDRDDVSLGIDCLFDVKNIFSQNWLSLSSQKLIKSISEAVDEVVNI